MAASLKHLLEAQSALHALARGLLGDAHLSEDVLQDVAVSALQSGNEAVAKPSYSKQTVRNRALNQKRARLRAARHVQAMPAQDSVPSAADMAALEEARQQVSQAVLALSDPYRTTIWLRYFEDLPPRQIAHRMGAPLNTVRTWLRRALCQLRERLDREHGCDRAAWCVALAPFTQRTIVWLAPTSLGLTGVLFMKKFLLIAAVLLATVLVGPGRCLWLNDSGLPPSPSCSEPSLAHSDWIVEQHRELHRSEVMIPRSKPADASTPKAITGSLEYANGQPAAGTNYWVWRNQQPAWTLPRSEAGYSPGRPQLGPPDGQTDKAGRWSAPQRIENNETDLISAVTFSISEAMVVSFTTSDDETCVLPAMGEITSYLEGGQLVDEWEVLYTPALAEVIDGRLEHNCAAHVVYPVRTQSGQAVVSVTQTTLEGRGSEPLVLNCVAGLPYQLSVAGSAVDLQPSFVHVAAPAATQHTVVRQRPTLEIELCDAAGVVVPATGVASCSPRPAHGIHYDKLESGRARITYKHIESGRLHATVLTSQGELFEREFHSRPVGNHKMRLTRGDGVEPVLIQLNRDTRVDEIACLLLHGTDGAVFAGLCDWMLHFDSGAALGRVDSQTWWLQDRGHNWVSGHLVLRSGRTAHLQRSSTHREAAIQVEWLPLDQLAPAALGKHRHAERGMFRYRLAVPHPNGDSTWVAVQSLQYGPFTNSWPTWKLSAPRGFDRELRHYRSNEPEVVIDLPAMH